ncbi:Uu.00g131430.m01.CDS01 [Anthostomella pinea]|uniref:Uu.00g131430.m01.CDS01 n=1 Tax=Anthostomella pinea TaxID=933095 RepID=A0AAI8VIV0_9PEZI|nr:Uu.00g131430.m01.CDS01 [Anthostomella pinea]
MASNTVYVKNISAKTEDKEIKDFFSFCGKITDIKVTPGESDTKDATVTFEKETAAKTAQLLNNTQLGTQQISVSPADGKTDDGAPHTSNDERDSDEITQEEKPRSRILAEYLAHGYVVGDATLQRAIELDTKHGVTNRFMTTLNNLDQKYHATDRAKATDQSYGISNRANSLFGGLSSYFEKATSSPTGQKLVNFYTVGQRQVQDIHAEARRLADLKKDEHGGSAYKASGLERVFGKEGEQSAAGGNTGASSVPAPGPKAGTAESTPLGTGADPAKGSGTEKA